MLGRERRHMHAQIGQALRHVKAVHGLGLLIQGRQTQLGHALTSQALDGA